MADPAKTPNAAPPKDPQGSDPGAKIRIHQMRKAILKKLYVIAKAGAKMTEEQVLAKMESETSSMFDQMLNLHRTTSRQETLKV